MELTIEQVISIILKNIVFIIISSIVFFIGAFVISEFFIEPTYVSSIKMYVVSKDHADSAPNLNDLNYAQKVVNTYIEILKTNSFFKKIEDGTSLGYDVEKLKKMVTFKVLNNTEIFQIDVSTGNPEHSKIIADSITINAPVQINEIKEDDTVKLVQPAELPTKPASPNKILNSAIGFVLGIAFAFLVSILREVLDVRVKGADDISAKYDIPILGSVPSFTIDKNKKNKKRA